MNDNKYYFVRHGFSCANLYKYNIKDKNLILKYYESSFFPKEGEGEDSILIELGILQCIISGYNFAKDGYKYDCVISSIMIRTIESAFFFLLGYNLINKNNTIIYLDENIKESGGFFEKFYMKRSDLLREYKDLLNFCKKLKNPNFVEIILEKTKEEFNNKILELINKKTIENFCKKIEFKDLSNQKNIFSKKNYDIQGFNINQFFNKINKLNFKNYLIFSHGVRIKDIRKELCNIDDKKIMFNSGIFLYYKNKCSFINKDIIKKYQYEKIYENKNIKIKNSLCTLPNNFYY